MFNPSLAFCLSLFCRIFRYFRHGSLTCNHVLPCISLLSGSYCHQVGETVLISACIKGLPDVVNALIESGVDVNDCNDEVRLLLLFVAIIGNNKSRLCLKSVLCPCRMAGTPQSIGLAYLDTLRLSRCWLPREQMSTQKTM